MTRRIPVSEWTDAHRAAFTQLWLEGVQQRRIARTVGYSGPAPICTAIGQFVRKFGGDEIDFQYLGPDRRHLAAEALRNYRASVTAAP